MTLKKFRVYCISKLGIVRIVFQRLVVSVVRHQFTVLLLIMHKFITFINVHYFVALSHSIHYQYLSPSIMSMTNDNLFVLKDVLASSTDARTELRSSVVAGINEVEEELRRRVGMKKLIFQVQ